MLLAILQNEFDDSYNNWVVACKKYGVNFRLIDLTSVNWIDRVRAEPFDGFLACPSGREDVYKRMYDERIYIIERVMGRFVFPSFNEISIHENKKYLSYWLEANGVPHPKTYVYYDKEAFLSGIVQHQLPIVGKMNIGASGKGVTIFRDRGVLQKYGITAFSSGIKQAWGPNLKMGNYWGRFMNLLRNPNRIVNRVQVYKKLYHEMQKGFVILQEYVPHDYEWRVVKIGNSYFGHQKVKQGDKASGTKGIDYVIPSVELLSFVRDLCARFGFNSMAVDLFEDGKGGYLVNEMQCNFGHVQDYICAKDNVPGRFVEKDGSWVFEVGSFNTNLSYDLRLQSVMDLLKGISK